MLGAAVSQWSADRRQDKIEEALRKIICGEPMEVEQEEDDASAEEVDEDHGRRHSGGKTVTREKGEQVGGDAFKVRKVLDNGDALAWDCHNYSVTALFPSQDGKEYYDGQIIRIPAGKCARQIGVYKGWLNQTYPIVEISDK